ncbi:transcriptional regulator [Nocardia arthritidis]|uniref:Transcriptional regulator n=1 Tax=Nocardia arthritidis TaxID=228602 RepID=A0A6G9YLQ7_9NOCA|nr:transcriptional regulator [Nocardia arthritidis]QIS13863.1 transcriptional regulator [Nocardia arthritidis]
MTRTTSSPELLVLHAVRLIGMADDATIAEHTGLDPDEVSELLGDYQAYGWVTRAEFAGTGGWALTDRGRAEDTRRLVEELDKAGARTRLEAAHREFDAPNARLLRACTDWQLRPGAGGRLAANDHSDPDWDAHVLDELSAVADYSKQLIAKLSGELARFAGYDRRFGAALERARAGDERWVAGIGIDSCHVVWMQLHEDLLSTLGISRGAATEPR